MTSPPPPKSTFLLASVLFLTSLLWSCVLFNDLRARAFNPSDPSEQLWYAAAAFCYFEIPTVKLGRIFLPLLPFLFIF